MSQIDKHQLGTHTVLTVAVTSTRVQLYTVCLQYLIICVVFCTHVRMLGTNNNNKKITVLVLEYYTLQLYVAADVSQYEY